MPRKDKHEEEIPLQDNNAATEKDIRIQVEIHQQDKEHCVGNYVNQVQQIYVEDVQSVVQDVQLVGLPIIAKSGCCDRRANGPAPEDGRDPTRSYCDKCDKHYKKPKYLKDHKAKRCGQEKKEFKCQTCGKEYHHHKEGLQDHLGKIHAQIKRHVCTQCTEAFYY